MGSSSAGSSQTTLSNCLHSQTQDKSQTFKANMQNVESLAWKTNIFLTVFYKMEAREHPPRIRLVAAESN